MHTLAGPTRLRCHDDGFHTCDVAAAEDLGVWDLVFPFDFTNLSEAVHVELFQLLEVRAVHDLCL